MSAYTRPFVIGDPGRCGPSKLLERIPLDAADPNPSSRAWFQAFWAEYLAKLQLDTPARVSAETAKSTNQFIPMPPGGASAWVSAYVAQSSGNGGVYLTFAKTFERVTAYLADMTRRLVGALEPRQQALTAANP